MTKRLVAVLCAFVLCLSFVLPVSANGVSVEVDTVTVSQGTIVTVPVRISGNTGLCGAQFSVYFADGLKLVEIEQGDALESLTFTPPGDLTANPVVLMWDGEKADETNGVIAKLKFNIEGLEAAEYPISIVPIEIGNYDNDLNDVSVTATDGKIVVDRPQIKVSEVSIGEKTEFKLQLISSDAISGVIYVATYNRDTMGLCTVKGYDAVAEKDFSIDTKNGEIVKLMWWDSYKNLRPITSCVIVEME